MLLSPEEPIAIDEAIVWLSFLWGSSTLWYHLTYPIGYYSSRLGTKTITATEIYPIIVETPIILFIIGILKLVWMVYKHTTMPLVPLFLVIAADNIPGVDVEHTRDYLRHNHALSTGSLHHAANLSAFQAGTTEVW